MSETMYQATIVASPEEVRKFEEQNIDAGPGHTRLEDGRIQVDAVLKDGQIDPLVRGGAEVILHAIIDPKFPDELIMNSQEIAVMARDLAIQRKEK